MGGSECKGDGWEEDDLAPVDSSMKGIRVDEDGEHGYQTLTVGEVRTTKDFVKVIVSEGGIIFLHPASVDQFSLGDDLKPGTVLEIKRSLWPNGGIEDIRAVSAMN